MRFSSSRAALAAVVGLSCVSMVGCGSAQHFPASPVPAVLTDREAVRMGELYLNQATPPSQPREVVSIEPTGDGHRIAFNTFFNEPEQPPKAVRVVMVKHDGKVRETTYTEE